MFIIMSKGNCYYQYIHNYKIKLSNITSEQSLHDLKQNTITITNRYNQYIHNYKIQVSHDQSNHSQVCSLTHQSAEQCANILPCPLSSVPPSLPCTPPPQCSSNTYPISNDVHEPNHCPTASPPSYATCMLYPVHFCTSAQPSD